MSIGIKAKLSAVFDIISGGTQNAVSPVIGEEIYLGFQYKTLMHTVSRFIDARRIRFQRGI